MDKKKETNRMVGIHPVGGKLCGGFYSVGFIQNAGFLQHVMNENAIAAGWVIDKHMGDGADDAWNTARWDI